MNYAINILLLIAIISSCTFEKSRAKVAKKDDLKSNNALNENIIGFNVFNQDTLEVQMKEFLNAIRNNDLITEYKYRSKEIKWWNKKKDSIPSYLDQTISFSEIGHIKDLKFKELHIEKENSRIMRLFFEEGAEKLMKKHRYAFYLNKQGLINGVLYVPPIIKESFDELNEDEFDSFSKRIDNEIEWETISSDSVLLSKEMLSCTAVMTPIEESYPSLNNNSRKNKIPYLK